MATVLLVEDERTLRAVLREYLEFSGFEVIAAADGEEALRHARSARVDVVVSDVLLPGFDGLELCTRFRADARLAGIKFLFMTARNLDEQLRAALQTAADGCIHKPFEPAALLSAIRVALQESQQRETG